jgi:hypothetical protein
MLGDVETRGVRRYRLRCGGEDINVTGPAFVIGRESDCDLVLDLISRHHASLTETEEGLAISHAGEHCKRCARHVSDGANLAIRARARRPCAVSGGATPGARFFREKP